MQMYKILALNCLVQAYSLSVLYYDGIKFGDTCGSQHISLKTPSHTRGLLVGKQLVWVFLSPCVSSLLLAPRFDPFPNPHKRNSKCILSHWRDIVPVDQPLERLSAERPATSVFSPGIVLSLLGQFLVHYLALTWVLELAHSAQGVENRASPDAEFSPNIVNTAVFLINSAMQVSAFAINHRVS